MKAFEDPKYEGNSNKYKTGEPCIEQGCLYEAGTKWSPYWCFECNVKRMKRIDSQLNNMLETFDAKK